jgi:hypothetical protein
MTLPEDDGAWLRAWTIPEEDRRKYTSEPWRGEARWFRSSNVVCLETWRRMRGQTTVRPEGALRRGKE